MATIWKGAISFGLVNIPVKLHSAVRDDGISFRMLDREKNCPVKYERVCKNDGEEVPWERIVKGYEYEKGKFVILEDEDFEKAAIATSRAFEIQDFVEESEIDPRFFEKPYYLVPDSNGEKPYALLREAMRESGTVAIGTITLRQKQYLAGIKVVGEALVLDVMRFAAEVVPESDYRFPAADDIRPQELKMAKQLIASLTESFEPEKYKDDYQANLKKIIQAKLKGKKVNLKESAEPEPTGVIDLMSRLEESLKASGKKPAKPAARKSKATAKSTSASSGSRRKSA
jgi:DNA end-binding protein Ku